MCQKLRLVKRPFRSRPKRCDPKHVEDNRDEMESSKNDSDTDYKPKIEYKAKKKSSLNPSF